MDINPNKRYITSSKNNMNFYIICIFDKIILLFRGVAMKKHILMHTNLIICFIIIIGFVSIAISNYYTYSKVIKDDIENISKLTSLNIYSEIDSELTKPIFVSLTMANDIFLKNWMYDETNSLNNEQYIQMLQKYLKEFQMKYKYNSVFLVSSKTNIYYHYEGIHKSISEKNDHDLWYYDFIKSDKLYDLNVDLDEADNNVLTVFVDCKIQDSNGSLLGVVGVGIKMNQLQDILKNYEDKFDINAILVNSSGVVQVHTNNDLIENINLFNMFPITEFKDSILSNKTSLQTYWYDSNNQKNCLITRYINNLKWYLIVEKNTNILRNSLLMQLCQNTIIIAVIIIILLVIVSYIISCYKNIMTTLITTDELTSLPNRRAFNKVIMEELNIQKQVDKETIVFIFDVDNFKMINDNFGHLFGDYVLNKIGHIAKKITDNSGFIARWGGDEFFGIIYDSDNETKEKLSELLDEISKSDEFQKYNISISIGATYIKKSDNFDSLLARADKGLYISKTNGRNQITYL